MKTLKFIENNNLSRKEFIKNWANIILNDKSNNWRLEHTNFINSQLINANNFYKRLLNTKDGSKKIIKKFNITNKKIIKKLNSKSKSQKKILIIKDNKEFIKF